MTSIPESPTTKNLTDRALAHIRTMYEHPTWPASCPAAWAEESRAILDMARVTDRPSDDGKAVTT